MDKDGKIDGVPADVYEMYVRPLLEKQQPIWEGIARNEGRTAERARILAKVREWKRRQRIDDVGWQFKLSNLLDDLEKGGEG